MSQEQRAKIDAIMRAPRPQPTTIAQMRGGYAASQANMLVPEEIETSETFLGERRALVVKPTERQRPGTLVYFHGGAWLMGSPETSLSQTANLVTRSGLTAYSLDYRLAPENPFPAAIDDCVTAYKALLDDGHDPAQIVFAGDSAGGGLAITTTLRAIKEGLPVPAAIATFSAGLDLTLSGDSMNTKEGIDPIFRRQMLQPLGGLYSTVHDPQHPLLSPVVSADLAGLPPLLLQVGTNEVLLDDSTRMATRAIEAGVDVILDVTEGVPHVFQAFAGLLDEADQALDRAALFLSQHVAP